MRLQDYSIEELKEEIANRDKPMLKETDFSSAELKKVCIAYIDYIVSDEYNEDRQGNYEHNIFEKAMEYCYESPWEWINANT